jgi:hypothetical protein
MVLGGVIILNVCVSLTRLHLHPAVGFQGSCHEDFSHLRTKRACIQDGIKVEQLGAFRTAVSLEFSLNSKASGWSDDGIGSVKQSSFLSGSGCTKHWIFGLFWRKALGRMRLVLEYGKCREERKTLYYETLCSLELTKFKIDLYAAPYLTFKAAHTELPHEKTIYIHVTHSIMHNDYSSQANFCLCYICTGKLIQSSNIGKENFQA